MFLKNSLPAMSVNMRIHDGKTLEESFCWWFIPIFGVVTIIPIMVLTVMETIYLLGKRN